MNQINFLSEAFLREQGRKIRIVREVLLIVIVLLMMAGWSFTELRRTQSLTRQVAQKRAETSDIESQMTQIQNLNRRHAELRQKLRLQNELSLSIEFSQVIAIISELMPESLTVMEMSMSAPRPTPRVKPKDDGKSSKKKKDETPSKPAPQYMQLVFIGVSPTDLDVANFVDRLTTHPLFSTVKVPYSRSTRIGTVVGRKFRVELEVPLDRVYVPRQADGSRGAEEGVAHAG